MVGITLSPEQIRAAPPQVRRWLEQEVAASLGLAGMAEPAPHPEPPHLVGCGVREVEAIFSLIQGLLPVVNVFLELGRDTGRRLPNGMHAFGLLDIQSHTQLGTPEQVLNCLEMINRALRQVSGDPHATLFGLDERANCFVAEETHQAIRQFWQQLVAGQGPGVAPGRGDGLGAPVPPQGMEARGFAPAPAGDGAAPH
ncbi:hypothetical protein QMO56_20665 [Roseomonas sp. E05]|uniref:hypothetical protein n=1 Tax=Roseomonas sp. E05 TaxID=3046310 RepID=UPI0024B89D28|nr:hypothetical protein [Roseomonas sp. E05]MDJ0390529.1 hypothetical protein [Roseomonas sp. E05]